MKDTRPLLGARELREVLDRHGVRPRKELGQNFVIDPNTIRKVTSAASLDAGDTVLEIGAGAGSLTLALAALASKVLAVEFDSRLIPALGEVLGDLSNVEVVAEDALRMDLSAIDATMLVANLPYNIATAIVVRVLEEAPLIRELIVMTQKEVGERLAAGPGSKTYGQVSVVVRYFAEARVVGRISRNAFWPVPNVDSVLVRMVRKPEPVARDPHLFAVIAASFSQRRKTLRNALAALAGSASAVEAACERAGISPGARAETIDLEGFIALAKEIERR